MSIYSFLRLPEISEMVDMYNETQRMLDRMERERIHTAFLHSKAKSPSYYIAYGNKQLNCNQYNIPRPRIRSNPKHHRVHKEKW